jgi:hypothetical protein
VAAHHIADMAFDYSAPAELFTVAGRGFKRRAMTYLRFPTCALAIQHAIEVLTPEMLSGAVMEVDEERFEAADIRQLYASLEYPLVRAKPL